MSQTGRRGKAPSESGGGHALAGGGPSQLGVDGSMRARDVSRPTEAEIAAAEDSVQVTRRNPPAQSPGSGGSGGSSPVRS